MQIQEVKSVLSSLVKASEEILAIYHSSNQLAIQVKLDESPVTQADLSSHNVMIEDLKAFGFPIISEEMENTPFEVRKTWDKCWILDPLDGTKEFIKRNDEFVICLALVENNKPVLGFIAAPCLGEILFGGKDLGVYRIAFQQIELEENWTRLTVKSELNLPLGLACSSSHFSHKDQVFIQLMEDRFQKIQFVRKGSALKFFDLAEEKASVYPRFAPTMEWDIAAGHAILRALEGEIFDAETLKPLHYNKENLLNPSFIAQTKAFRLYIREA